MESRFEEIIAWLEVTGKKRAEEMEGYRREWAVREAEEENLREVERRRDSDRVAFGELVAAVERWRQAEMIRGLWG